MYYPNYLIFFGEIDGVKAKKKVVANPEVKLVRPILYLTFVASAVPIQTIFSKSCSDVTILDSGIQLNFISLTKQRSNKSLLPLGLGKAKKFLSFHLVCHK